MNVSLMCAIQLELNFSDGLFSVLVIEVIAYGSFQLRVQSDGERHHVRPMMLSMAYNRRSKWLRSTCQQPDNTTHTHTHTSPLVFGTQ